MIHFRLKWRYDSIRANLFSSTLACGRFFFVLHWGFWGQLAAVASCFPLSSREPTNQWGDPGCNRKPFLGKADVQEVRVESCCPSGSPFIIANHLYLLSLILSWLISLMCLSWDWTPRHLENMQTPQRKKPTASLLWGNTVDQCSSFLRRHLISLRTSDN